MRRRPLRPFPGQWELALLQDAALAGDRGGISGRIAQLVEQLTLNQRVPGSSPGAPTIDVATFFPISPQNISGRFEVGLKILFAFRAS
jgi:hypothetical protein